MHVSLQIKLKKVKTEIKHETVNNSYKHPKILNSHMHYIKFCITSKKDSHITQMVNKQILVILLQKHFTVQNNVIKIYVYGEQLQ
jgi:hypothetical protein